VIPLKINYDDILEEIKTPALMFKKIIPYWKESTFKKVNYVQKMVKGKCKVKLKYKEVYLDNVSKTRVCLYQSLESRDNPAVLLYLHGGGYAMGYPEMAEELYYELITKLNVCVVAPDYRLSLEHPFPAGLNDCFDSLKWLMNEAKNFGIDSTKIIVAGDSAGGGLTCALSLLANKNDIMLLGQLPLYPMIDDTMSTDSAIDNDAPVWNTLSSKIAWELYLREVKEITELAAPARTREFENLPPTYSFIGDLDPFLDETKTYFEQLDKAGVKSKLRVFKGCYHGFERAAPKAEVSKDANAFVVKALQEILNDEIE